MALEAIQALGGNGYINDFPTGRLLRDAKLYEIDAGTTSENDSDEILTLESRSNFKLNFSYSGLPLNHFRTGLCRVFPSTSLIWVYPTRLPILIQQRRAGLGRQEGYPSGGH